MASTVVCVWFSTREHRHPTIQIPVSVGSSSQAAVSPPIRARFETCTHANSFVIGPAVIKHTPLCHS